MKLNLGCGKKPREGFVNVDIRRGEGVDLVFDLTDGWPLEDDSVELIEAANLLSYLTADERVFFMQEAWRVLKRGAPLVIQVPGRGSNLAIMDPHVRWPEICEDWFHNFSEEGREAFGLDTEIDANFHWQYGWVLSPEWQPKHEEAQRFALKHYRDAMQWLVVTCNKLSRGEKTAGKAPPMLEPEVVKAEPVEVKLMAKPDAADVEVEDKPRWVDPSGA